MRQIKIVLSAYIISLFLRLSVSLVTLLFLDDLFTCTRIDGVSIITSDQPIGQVILVVSEFNQLLPHIVIPIAMYLIPLERLSRKNKSFHLNTGLIDEHGDSDDENAEFEEDAAESRLSSLLNSRMSDEHSPMRKPKP